MARAKPRLVAGGASLFGAVVALAGIVHCADATEIVVEIYSDACPPSGRAGKVAGDTAITVGTKETIERAKPGAVKSGCDDPAAGLVGTLTIYPSGEKDGEVTFRVLTAVDRPIGSCTAAEGWVGCIEQARTVRFVPRTTQTVVIQQSVQCLNLRCPGNQLCVNGSCFDPNSVQDDGAASPDATGADASFVDGPSTGLDAGPDADGGTCGPGCNKPFQRCEGGFCVSTCDASGECDGEMCSPGLDCIVRCTTSDACKNVECGTGKSCRFECLQPNSCRESIACSVARCDVACAAPNACPTMSLSGNDANVSCAGNKACGPLIACAAAKCTLTCSGNSCPDKKTCVAGGAACQPPGAW